MIVLSVNIPHRFEGMNSYSGAQRTNQYVGAKMKKQETQIAELHFRGIDAVDESEYPLDLVFHWYEPNKRRDPDNIASAKKFILDGMQKAGVIRNDGWNEISSTQDIFSVRKDAPGVIVTLMNGKFIHD